MPDYSVIKIIVNCSPKYIASDYLCLESTDLRTCDFRFLHSFPHISIVISYNLHSHCGPHEFSTVLFKFWTETHG